MSAAYYYNSATCLAAYLLLLILGWRMHHFVHRNLNGNGINQTKIRELNIQLTRTLIIEVKCDFTQFLSIFIGIPSILDPCIGSLLSHHHVVQHKPCRWIW